MLPPVPAPAPGFPEARAVIDSLAGALSQAPPPRVVALSSVGSQQTSRLGGITATHLLEQALAGLPCPTAFVRAGSFLENYAHALGPAATTGRFDTFLDPPARRVPMVATADIGDQAARLLTGDWAGRRVIELGSPISPDDLASAMGQVIGRPVQACPIPREQWAAVLEATGMPPGRTGPFEEMEDGFNSGWIGFGVPGTEAVAGTVTPACVFDQAWRAREAG
jgi:uncharacterized protein YbjT (DUF2867 family)